MKENQENKEMERFPNKDNLWPVSFKMDEKVTLSAKPNQYFISLRNGILSLNKDGTWEWSERPE